MFTGIVQATCNVVDIIKKPGLQTHTISLPGSLATALTTGASVANNGVCLTVTHIADNNVSFDVMEESLALTNLANIDIDSQINIERSMTFGAEIGGHILSGHVHTQAVVVEVSATDEHYNIKLEIEPQWMKYIFYKGFIGINGCSLTVGKVTGCQFMVHLIPETLKLTNLGLAKVGDKLNIEIDSQTQTIVDTVERVLAEKERTK